MGGGGVTYLHDELAGVGAGHRRALARRQNADGPDVHGGRAVLAAEEDALEGSGGG